MTTVPTINMPIPTLCVLHAPKEGNQDDQYEDAVAHTALDAAAAELTVALSDGASSAVYAREWANLLVGRFANGEPYPAADKDVATVVAELGKQWREQAEGKSTSWWAQEKVPSGSAATLLVVTWDREKSSWKARVVGDVCLFVIRADKLKYAFPITKSNRFDDRPSLLSTKAGKPFKVTRFETTYEAGDRFLLMTDALSAWFLAEYEAKRKPWNDLPADNAALAAWLKSLRDNSRIKNDDVTLVDLVL
jgi:hypothetical protein